MATPKIRLKGFEGEWKVTRFSDIANIRRGLTFTPSDINNDGIRVLRSSNINEDWFQVSDDDIFVNENCVNIAYVNNNDILITAANGSPRLVGKHCLIKKALDEKMVHGGFMLLATSQESPFVNASMSSRWFRDFQRVGIAGGNGAIGNLNKNILESYKFHIPETLGERESIATYFQSLDNLIQTTTKKIESLKQMKAASLISMFPQEGETVPKVRFKGFEGEWKSKKLAEIASFSKGNGYSKNDLCNNGTPIILYGQMYTNYSIVIDNLDTYTTPRDGSVYSKGGEVIIPGSGETPEDIAVASTIKRSGVIIGGDLNILYFDSDKFDSAFMAISITHSKTHFELSKYAQGKTIVHLRNGDIANGSVEFPSIAEQSAIASYFNNLNAQISLQSQRLEKLKQIKAECLNKMFV